MWRFKVGGKYENDPKNICRTLIDQDKPVFSSEGNERVEDEVFNHYDGNAVIPENNITKQQTNLKRTLFQDRMESQPSS